MANMTAVNGMVVDGAVLTANSYKEGNAWRSDDEILADEMASNRMVGGTVVCIRRRGKTAIGGVLWMVGNNVAKTDEPVAVMGDI